MTTQRSDSASIDGSPIGYSEVLGRPIRQDGLATLGTSTQTLAEAGAARWPLGRWRLSWPATS